MGKLEEAGKAFIKPLNYGNGMFLYNLYIHVIKDPIYRCV